MLRRFAEMEESPHRAFERTLLYACERLQRQETRIRPALREGGLIVTHYFSLAPVVFQQMEGLMDTTVARAIANVLLEPDVVVFFKCDPRMAAGRAVSCRPGKGQFFSPYSGVDRFRKAQELYEAQMEEVRASGVTVHVLDGRKASTRLSEAVFRAVSPLLPSASAAGARRVGPAGRQ
jgi:thymidylate kinase